MMKTDNYEVKSLNLTINYEPDSIVSRTLIDKGRGSITLFSFAKDQSLSEHTAPFDAFVTIIDGEMEIKIDRQPYKVKKGEYIIMPANINHSLLSLKDSKMLLVMIKD